MNGVGEKPVKLGFWKIILEKVYKGKRGVPYSLGGYYINREGGEEDINSKSTDGTHGKT